MNNRWNLVESAAGRWHFEEAGAAKKKNKGKKKTTKSAEENGVDGRNQRKAATRRAGRNSGMRNESMGRENAVRRRRAIPERNDGGSRPGSSLAALVLRVVRMRRRTLCR